MTKVLEALPAFVRRFGRRRSETPGETAITFRNNGEMNLLVASFFLVEASAPASALSIGCLPDDACNFAISIHFSRSHRESCFRDTRDTCPWQAVWWIIYDAFEFIWNAIAHGIADREIRDFATKSDCIPINKTRTILESLVRARKREQERYTHIFLLLFGFLQQWKLTIRLWLLHILLQHERRSVTGTEVRLILKHSFTCRF